MQVDPVTDSADLTAVARRGIVLCRRGDWADGLALLGEIAEAPRAPELPPTFYSYLGYGIARFGRRRREGLSLCEYAVKAEICEPENYLNLARVLLLLGKRGRALGVLNRGLALGPEDTGLVDLRTELGVRRAPVLPFLARSNALNRLLGHLRHRARRARA